MFTSLLLAWMAGACASAPPFQGMSAEEVFFAGRQAYDSEEWDEALRALDRLVLSFPEFPEAAEARLMLARAYLNDGRYLVAADEFRRFLDRHIAHPAAPEAALGVCQAQAALSPISARDQTYTEQAVTVCRNVATNYRDTEVSVEAARIANEMRAKLALKAYDNGDFYFRRGALDSAIIVWEALVQEYGDTEWAPRALLGIVRAYEEIGYEDLVQEYRDRLLNSYPDSEAAAQLRDNGGGL